MTVGHGSPQVGNQASPRAKCISWRFVRSFALTVLIAATNSGLGQQQKSENILPTSTQSPANGPATSTSINSQISDQLSAEKHAIELRIVWGGGSPRPFQGDISIDSGSIKLVRNLSLQSDSIGSITSAGLSMLKVAGHSASTFGGADVNIEGASNSRVTLRFVHPTTNQPIEHSFLVSEVMNDRWLRKLDDLGNRVAAERQMQDRMRVRPSQVQSIFQVNSIWMGTLSGYRCGLQAGEYHLTTKLLDQSKGDVVVSEQEQTVTIDDQGNFNVSSLEVPLPQIESSYAIEFSLNRKRFLQSFVNSSQSLTRRVDLVVFDPLAQPKRIEYWAPIATIQPLNSQWWNSMNWFSPSGSTQPLVSLPGFSEQNKRLVSHGSQSSRKVGDEECLTLGPTAWQAYPLTVENLGQPHRLRVRVPRDQPQQLVISIRDYHANGEPTTLNVDSGIVLGERQANMQESLGKGSWADHEIVFWPRSSKPVVLMFNPSSTDDAAFGEMQLEVGQLQVVANADDKTKQPKANGSDQASRMVALYLTKPLLADAFGAQHNIDPTTKRALDSWATWQQSSERVAQYMQNAGYNTLILNIAGDGGAVLPLSRLAPTTRFDSGTFYSDGRSPEIKDFVELLCNHLDRSGLKTDSPRWTSIATCQRWQNGSQTNRRTPGCFK